jgi:hypothetical protein
VVLVVEQLAFSCGPLSLVGCCFFCPDRRVRNPNSDNERPAISVVSSQTDAGRGGNRVNGTLIGRVSNCWRGLGHRLRCDFAWWRPLVEQLPRCCGSHGFGSLFFFDKDAYPESRFDRFLVCLLKREIKARHFESGVDAKQAMEQSMEKRKIERLSHHIRLQIDGDVLGRPTAAMPVRPCTEGCLHF